MPSRKNFDQAYYRRFYGGAAEQRSYRREEQRLGNFICSYLNYIEQPISTVVDIGCGLGQWRDIIASHFPRATYTGVELSEHLCAQFGWQQGSAVDYQTDRSFDLVICKDTLQYLADAEFRAAIDNIAGFCSGVLFASILTSEDWDSNCDKRRTDKQVYLRNGNWYRRVLGRYFINLGGGLFLNRESSLVVWELEQLPAGRR